jgi:hypothetical protein
LDGSCGVMIIVYVWTKHLWLSTTYCLILFIYIEQLKLQRLINMKYQNLKVMRHDMLKTQMIVGKVLDMMGYWLHEEKIELCKARKLKTGVHVFK